MKFLGIIPARYASTRFPAKPLFSGCMNKWPVFWTTLTWLPTTSASKLP